MIAENLSKNWRKLGRKLGLSEVKLESISKRHPTDIEETVVEMLKEWRIHRGAEARTIDLLEALKACQYNLTADKVEEKLAQADVDAQWQIKLGLTFAVKIILKLWRQTLTFFVYTLWTREKIILNDHQFNHVVAVSLVKPGSLFELIWNQF